MKHIFKTECCDKCPNPGQLIGKLGIDGNWEIGRVTFKKPPENEKFIWLKIDINGVGVTVLRQWDQYHFSIPGQRSKNKAAQSPGITLPADESLQQRLDKAEALIAETNRHFKRGYLHKFKYKIGDFVFLPTRSDLRSIVRGNIVGLAVNQSGCHGYRLHGDPDYYRDDQLATAEEMLKMLKQLIEKVSAAKKGKS